VTVTYETALDERLPNGVRLVASWTGPALALGYATFETGDHFTEWYFSDRWYNILRIATSGGVLKGWYCNVAEPAEIDGDAVRYRDLLLDLWIAPDGTTHLLDEEEFAAEPALTDDLRRRALDALAELESLVQGRVSPFDSLPSSPSGASPAVG
jgi:predicted RNA-binding protein associated with RNAse of E/G family